MKKILMAATACALAFPATANAAFLVTYTNVETIPATGTERNDFSDALASYGITSFTSTGATIALTEVGNITLEFFGKEARLGNAFTLGTLSYTQPFGSPTEDHFSTGDNSPTQIGTITLTPAEFDPKFYTNGTGIALTPGTENFGIGLPGTASGGSFTTNQLWLMFDDNNQDDNHDDLIIRATFGAVPEPATWAMMLAGFGAMGLMLRGRRPARVSFA